MVFAAADRVPVYSNSVVSLPVSSTPTLEPQPTRSSESLLMIRGNMLPIYSVAVLLVRVIGRLNLVPM